LASVFRADDKDGLLLYGFVRVCAGLAMELPQAQSDAVAQVVREQLARRRMSRQRLADEARISLSTLEKALNGSRGFTLATLVRLEQVLGISLRADAEAQLQSPDALGAYSHAAVKMLEGAYLTLRPSFEVAGAVYAYRTDLAWDGAKLVFAESERLDAENAQMGVVSVPIPSGHIYLSTNASGQMRLAVLGRQLRSGEMYGLLTTLFSGSGAHLQPVAAPLALIPLKGEALFGRVLPGQPRHDDYQRHLARVIESGFARLVI
jgi:transcriptional regulator with XRE-family HTH domain